MLIEFLHYGLLVGLAIALLFAAFTDLRRRQIDNWLNAGIALAAPVFWWSSGLSIWPGVAMQLGDEFALTAIELSFLSERKTAFNNLAYRVDLEQVRGVVTTMVQTERYGTPLASALRVLSAEFRNERMMRAEEKAARLPAIMPIPLIMFILPVLFIVILGPAACSISDALFTDR